MAPVVGVVPVVAAGPGGFGMAGLALAIGLLIVVGVLVTACCIVHLFTIISPKSQPRKVAYINVGVSVVLAGVLAGASVLVRTGGPERLKKLVLVVAGALLVLTVVAWARAYWCRRGNRAEVEETGQA